VSKKIEKPGQGKLDSNIKGIYKRFRNGFYRPNLLLTLEKRQMFDGAAGALLADDLVDEGANGTEESLPTPVETPTPATSQSETNEPAAEAGVVAEEVSQETSTEDAVAALDDESATDIEEDDSADSESLEDALAEDAEVENEELELDDVDPVFSETVASDELLDEAAEELALMDGASEVDAEVEVETVDLDPSEPVTPQTQSQEIADTVESVTSEEPDDEEGFVQELAAIAEVDTDIVDYDDADVEEVIFIDAKVLLRAMAIRVHQSTLMRIV